jgi:hypothetical protein
MVLRSLAALFVCVLTAGLVLAPDSVMAGSLGLSGKRAAPARTVSPPPMRPPALVAPVIDHDGSF